MRRPSLPAATITRLEKVAVDNGFDQELPREGDWLHFTSTRAPLSIWLSSFTEGSYVAALSRLDVARALGEHGTLSVLPPPAGATAARTVPDIPALHHLVRRAFQLARSLPDELLRVFERKTAALPKTTEAERLVVQRVGQDVFRAGLLEYWEWRCAITGLAIAELLRASHIKPWARCANDAERLDVFNGLLLSPNFDAAFDRGYITVADNGAVVVSSVLAEEARRALGVGEGLRVRNLADAHRSYLAWHREYWFEVFAVERGT